MKKSIKLLSIFTVFFILFVNTILISVSAASTTISFSSKNIIVGDNIVAKSSSI